MTNLARLLTATAAIGSLAAPAAAQYNQYPQYQQTYPQYQQQTYPSYGQGYGQSYNNNSISGIINQLLGNQYNVTDRQAVSQCATAAVAQAQNQYGNQYRGNGYNQGYNRGYGYQQGYAAPAMRVTAITDVQRRSSGLRVKGMLSSGYAGNRAYGGNGQYGYQNQNYAAGDLTFRCNVDYRGAVTNVRISSNDTYRRY
jgi:hypothetical protein